MKKATELLNENHSILDVGIISEAGLSRLVDKVKTSDFCILTAFRSNNSLKINKKLNKELLNSLNKNKMGPYALIGHWQEAPDGVEYKDASPEQLADAVEDSFLFTRPAEMSFNDFKKIVLELIKKYNQDAAVISKDGEISLIYKTGDTDVIGNKVSLNKINQAYSQMRKKPNVPFVFEGTRMPSTPGMMGHLVFEKLGLNYLRNL